MPRLRSRHQSPHHFVADANWSDEQMLLRVCQWVVPLMAFSDGGWWWIIDDTGLPKQGRHSAGVARLYGAMLSKQDNCQVDVSVSLACEAASVPAALQFATRPAIALKQIEHLLDQGAPRHCVLADAPEFDTRRPFSAPNRPCTPIKSTAYRLNT